LITIIIVNYRTSDFILKCIKSIEENCSLELEIIVIDNKSDDKGIDKLEENFPKVKLIKSNENYGFGKACNTAQTLSNGEYLLFLNPDIVVQTNSIEYLYENYRKLKAPGILTGVLMSKSKEIQYSYNKFPSFKWEFNEAFSIGLLSTIRGLNDKIKSTNNYFINIDWADGAVLFIKKSIFEEVNGFDEDYFLYYEDVDLQKRLANSGRKNYLITNSKFYHHERSSIDPDKPRIIYFHNMHYHKLLYYKKHHKWYFQIILRILYIAAFSMRILLLPVKVKSKKEYINRFKEYMAVLKVYFQKVKYRK